MSLEGAGVDLANLNYTVLEPYNDTVPTGGDSLTQNLNVYYEVCYSSSTGRVRVALLTDLQSGDIAWLITSTALVLLMIPGVG